MTLFQTLFRKPSAPAAGNPFERDPSRSRGHEKRRCDRPSRQSNLRRERFTPGEYRSFPKSFLLFLSMNLAMCGRGADVLLFCPFDGSAEPAHAAGPGFTVYRQCRFVPGHRDLALFLDRVHAPVGLVEAGNLDKARGSVEFWLQPGWNGADAGDHALVWEPGSRKPGAQVLWLWKYGRTIRFDVRDPGDHYLTASIAKWKRAEWHHVLATWDCRKGTRLYLDGKKAAEKEFTWQPVPHARILLGARGTGDLPADAAFDDFRVYAEALSETDAARASAGTLSLHPVKSLRNPPSNDVRTTSPSLVFRLSFDTGTARADSAGGQADPLERKEVTFVSGVRGRAAHFGKKTILRYAIPGNLVKERGTVMFWFRPDWPGRAGRRSDGGEVWRCLFQEGPKPAKRHGSNQTWIWFWGDRLRADVSDALDRYITTPITDWNAGDWHFIAMVWDSKRLRRLYVDGVAVRGGGDSRKPFLPMQWKVRDFPWFAVGSDSRGGAAAAGAIDELKIYNGPLSAAAVRAEFARVFPIVPEMTHRYYRAERKARVRWALRNLAEKALLGKIAVSCVGPDGKTLFASGPDALRMPSGSRQDFSREVFLSRSGPYECRFAWTSGNGVSMHSRIVFRAVSPALSAPAGSVLQLDPVTEIDCTASLPESRFVSSAPTHEVVSAAGRYREAGPKRHDRLAWRLRLPQADAPYLIDWEYPDDKPRTMEIVAQSVAGGSSAYELGAGVFCGAEYPLSMQMHTSRFLYWASARDVALILMTCENGRPAAARRITVRRIVGRLPKLPVESIPSGDGWRRMVGLYYEDPAMCYDFGGYTAMPDFQKTVSRLMDYMDWFGQNLFMYPAVWYQGPLFPSGSQGTAMSRPHPPNFIEYMLLQFSSRGISFIPTWNLHNLPDVGGFVWSDDMLIDGRAAAAPLMIYWDGSPNLAGWHGTPPNYNPLDPAVRRSLLTMTDEMLDLYADYPAFKGICFHLTKHAMLWFGDLDAGYNDTCIEAFRKDTGIRIPVRAADPGRVNKRYRWLMKNARDKWIDWRCGAIHALYAEIAEKLHRRRSDLRLILNVYRPTKNDIMTRDAARFRRKAYVKTVWREAGLDPQLYAADSNIVIQRTVYPADYRWYRAHRRYTADPIAVQQLNYEPRTYSALSGSSTAWINMHDRYWEDAVGRTSKWKNFWGREIGWRVSTLNPIPRFSLEPYIKPLAVRDIASFTKGGFLVGTLGIEKEIGRFSRAFRALPAKPFESISGVPGPTVVRRLPGSTGAWFYIVNPGTTPIGVRLKIGGLVRALRDLATGKERKGTPGIHRFSVPPVGFAAYFISGKGITLAAP